MKFVVLFGIIALLVACFCSSVKVERRPLVDTSNVRMIYSAHN